MRKASQSEASQPPKAAHQPRHLKSTDDTNLRKCLKQIHLKMILLRLPCEEVNQRRGAEGVEQAGTDNTHIHRFESDPRLQFTFANGPVAQLERAPFRKRETLVRVWPGPPL